MEQGAWYWVKIRGEWYPAQYDVNSCGGWTNMDTWEDFDHEVVEWQIIIHADRAGGPDRVIRG